MALYRSAACPLWYHSVAISLQRLIDSAALLAGVEAKDTELSILVPRVLYRVTDKFGADEASRHVVTQTQLLTLNNGTVTLPSNVMVKYLQFAAVEDGASPPDLTFAKKMRWARSWQEFTRPLDNSLGYFIARGVSGNAALFLVEPGGTYSPISGASRDILLTTVCMPASPTLPASQLLSPPEFEAEAVLVLADALKDPSVLLLPVKQEAAA